MLEKFPNTKQILGTTRQISIYKYGKNELAIPKSYFFQKGFMEESCRPPEFVESDLDLCTFPKVIRTSGLGRSFFKKYLKRLYGYDYTFFYKLTHHLVRRRNSKNKHYPESRELWYNVTEYKDKCAVDF